MGTRAHPSELRRVRLTLICASNLSSRAAGGRVPRPHASVRVTRDWNQSRACTAEINAEKIALRRYNFVRAYIAPRIQMFIDDMEAHAKKKPGSLLIFPSGWRSADVRDQVPVMLCFTRNNDGEGFSDGEPTCTLTVVNACADGLSTSGCWRIAAASRERGGSPVTAVSQGLVESSRRDLLCVGGGVSRPEGADITNCGDQRGVLVQTTSGDEWADDAGKRASRSDSS